MCKGVAVAMMGSYLNKLEAKGRKKITIEGYSQVLKIFITWIYSRGFNGDPTEITADVMMDFIRNYDVTENTMKQYIRVIHSFLRKECNNNVIDSMDLLWNENVCENVVWITQDDLGKLLSIADPHERIILILGAYCGLRGIDMSQIRIGDIKQRSIIVHGKGHGNGKVREVPMSDIVRSELILYLNERTEMLKDHIDETDNHLLWCVYNGNMIRPMATKSIQYRMRQLSERSGIKITAHSLRRLFVTTLDENGVSDTVIVGLAGWSSTQMLTRYVRNDQTRLADAVNLLSIKYNTIATV